MVEGDLLPSERRHVGLAHLCKLIEQRPGLLGREPVLSPFGPPVVLHHRCPCQPMPLNPGVPQGRASPGKVAVAVAPLASAHLRSPIVVITSRVIPTSDSRRNSCSHARFAMPSSCRRL